MGTCFLILVSPRKVQMPIARSGVNLRCNPTKTQTLQFQLPLPSLPPSFSLSPPLSFPMAPSPTTTPIPHSFFPKDILALSFSPAQSWLWGHEPCIVSTDADLQSCKTAGDQCYQQFCAECTCCLSEVWGRCSKVLQVKMCPTHRSPPGHP